MANSQIINSDFTNSTFIKTDMPTTKIENSIFKNVNFEECKLNFFNN